MAAPDPLFSVSEIARTGGIRGGVAPNRHGQRAPRANGFGARASLRLAAIHAVFFTVCGGCAVLPPKARAATVLLQLAVTPPEASVRIDDHFTGTARGLEGRWIALAPGVHRLAVSASGFDLHEEDLDLAAGSHSRVIALPMAPER